MKQQARFIDCNGEAHNNPNIDNCAICMPFWQRYPVCPYDGIKLSTKGYCKGCKKYYDIAE